MRDNINVNKKLLLAKTLGYRGFGFIINLIIFGIILGDWKQALGFSLIIDGLKLIAYFFYDYFFSKFFRTTNNKGFVLWFTGLPCSGKTSLAKALKPKLEALGCKVEHLDGDIVRAGGLCNDLGFSPEDRQKNLNRISFISKLLSRNEVATLCTFVSPYRKVRQEIRENTTNFIEVQVLATEKECERRDVKGMWKLAREGKIKDFTGVSAPYEADVENSEIVCVTQYNTVEESCIEIMTYLKEKGLV